MQSRQAARLADPALRLRRKGRRQLSICSDIYGALARAAAPAKLADDVRPDVDAASCASTATCWGVGLPCPAPGAGTGRLRLWLRNLPLRRRRQSPCRARPRARSTHCYQRGPSRSATPAARVVRVGIAPRPAPPGAATATAKARCSHRRRRPRQCGRRRLQRADQHFRIGAAFAVIARKSLAPPSSHYCRVADTSGVQHPARRTGRWRFSALSGGAGLAFRPGRRLHLFQPHLAGIHPDAAGTGTRTRLDRQHSSQTSTAASPAISGICRRTPIRNGIPSAPTREYRGSSTRPPIHGKPASSAGYIGFVSTSPPAATPEAGVAQTGNAHTHPSPRWAKAASSCATPADYCSSATPPPPVTRCFDAEMSLLVPGRSLGYLDGDGEPICALQRIPHARPSKPANQPAGMIGVDRQDGSRHWLWTNAIPPLFEDRSNALQRGVDHHRGSSPSGATHEEQLQLAWTVSATSRRNPVPVIVTGHWLPKKKPIRNACSLRHHDKGYYDLSRGGRSGPWASSGGEVRPQEQHDVSRRPVGQRRA